MFIDDEELSAIAQESVLTHVILLLPVLIFAKIPTE